MGLDKAKSKGTCWKVCVALLVIFLLASVGGLSGTSYFLRTIVPFTDKGILKTLTGCGECLECMACLSGVTGEDVEALCDPLINIFQCVVQFVYLYGRPDYGQPCYDVCNPCQECLDTTTFGSLDRLTSTLWETTFPDFLHTPESMGYTNYSVSCTQEGPEMCRFNATSGEDFSKVSPQRRKRQALFSDLCCGTRSEELPYTFVHTDGDGVVWYPVWFNIPWNDLPYQYQFYHDVECQLSSASCDPSISCQPARRKVTFLISSKHPSEKTGFLYQPLVLPDKKVKFMDFDLITYCHCVSQ